MRFKRADVQWRRGCGREPIPCSVGKGKQSQGLAAVKSSHNCRQRGYEAHCMGAGLAWCMQE